MEGDRSVDPYPVTDITKLAFNGYAKILFIGEIFAALL